MKVLKALQERDHPQRILTTSLKIRVPDESVTASGQGYVLEPLLPVRSDRPADRDEMRGLVRRLQKISLDADRVREIRRGDVLLENVGRNHVSIIAERSLSENK